MSKDFDSQMNLVVEKGQKMNKDGRVAVYVTKNQEEHSLQVEVSGTAVYVKEFQISI